SGGEQQMLAIARALVGNPSVVLMDEPSEGLAPVIVEELARAVKRLAATEGLTLILVEQNTQLALDISPRVAVMDLRRIVYDGPTEELRRDPEKLHRLVGVGKGCRAPRMRGKRFDGAAAIMRRASKRQQQRDQYRQDGERADHLYPASGSPRRLLRLSPGRRHPLRPRGARGA